MLILSYFSPIISDLPYDLFKMTMHTMQTFVADAGKGYIITWILHQIFMFSNNIK